MAGVFKSLDQSDVRITPFRTHKQWLETDVSYDITPRNTTNISTTAGQIYELKSNRAAEGVSKGRYYYYHTGEQTLYSVNRSFTTTAGSVNISNVITGSWTYLPGLIRTGVDGYVGYVNTSESVVYMHNVDFSGAAISTASIKNGAFNNLISEGINGLAFNQEWRAMEVYGRAGASGSGRYWIVYDSTGSLANHGIGTNTPTSSSQYSYLGGVASASPLASGNNFYAAANITAGQTNLIRYRYSQGGTTNNVTLTTPAITKSVKDMICAPQANLSCSVFFTFKDTLGLWTTYENNVPVKHPWNVANLLVDKSDYISGSGWVTDRRVHAVLKDGTIVLDLTVDSSNNFSYGETIACNHYVGSGEVKAAVINTDATVLYTNADSIITVYGVTTTNTAYVYHYNVTTETLSPITHLGRLPYKGFGDGGTSTINLLAAYREDSTIGLLHTIAQTPVGDSPNLYTFST